MSRVAINTGSVANDGTGDSLRIAGGIINDNFSEIYSQFGDGTSLTPTWDKTAAGINTTSSVGIGTTNPRFTLEVGAVGTSGTSLWVNGNARVTGILTVGSSSIVLDGNANKILVGSGISFDGNTGIISATAFYAGGSIVSGGGGGGLNYWGSSASGISTTANVAIGTVTPTSKLTVVGNSLFSGIATFRSNITLANLTSSSNTLRFGSNSYIDQSNNDVVTFQINSGIDGSGADSSFVFRTTEPRVSPLPDEAYDALRVYSGGNYWNRLVRVYTNFHADNNAFVGGDLQVGAASTLIGAGSTLGSFKVGAGGTVINTTSSGLVGIGTTNPTSALTVKGNTSLETLSVSGIATISGDGTNAYLRYGSTNAYTNFVTTYNVSQVGGVPLISADANGAALSADTTLNAAYWRIQTLGAGVTVNGTTFTNQLNVSGVSTFSGTINANNVGAGISVKLSNSVPTYLEMLGVGNYNATLKNIYDSNSSILVHSGAVELRSGGTNNYTVFNGTIDGTAQLMYRSGAKLSTLSNGIDVDGTIFTDNLSVSGISTCNGDVNVGIDTSSGVVLTSPNGTQYRLIVANDGTLSTTAV